MDFMLTYNTTKTVIKRNDLITKIMLYYIKNFDNYENSKYLLDKEDIKRLNSIIIPNTNISSILNISTFLNLNIQEKNDYDNLSDNSSENLSDIEDDIREVNFEDKNKLTLKLKDEENINNDFIYNIQTCIKEINLNELKKKLNDELTKNSIKCNDKNNSKIESEKEIDNSIDKNKKNKKNKKIKNKNK